jgi:hypothetical protein
MISKIIKTLSIIVLSIVISCTFKEPVLPSWLLPLNIPLSQETFKLSEFVNDSTIVAQGQDSLLFISIEGDLDSTGLSRDHLSIASQQRTETILLDSLELDSLNVINTDTIKVADLLDLTPLIGQTVTVPDTIIDMPDIVGLRSSDFRRLHVLKGLIRLKIKNTLPFPIGPDIGFTVKNDTVNNEQIAQVIIPDTVFPGQQGEGSDQVGNGGIDIYSPLGLEFQLQIAKETSFLVTQELLDTAGFWIELSLENIRADEATVKLRKQKFNDKISITYEDENRLRTAEIDSGTIQLHLINYLPVGCNVNYTIPDIRTEAQPLTGSLTLLPAQVLEEGIDLKNLSIENADNPGEFIDTIIVDIAGTTLPTNGFVTITSRDSILVEAQTSRIILKSFKGFFALDTLEVPEFSEDSIADYGDFSKGVFFQNAELELNITSEVSIENLFLEFDVLGYHADENGIMTDSASLSISQTVNSTGSPGDPDNIILSISGDSVTNFLNILPTSIKGMGRITLEGEASITQNSKVWAGYLFSTPLRLIVSNLPPIEGTITTFIGKGDNTPYEGATAPLDSNIVDLSDELESGNLELDIVNHTPSEVEVRMLVSGDLSRPDSAFYNSSLNDSLEFEKSALVSAAAINMISGFVTTPQTSTVSFDLTKDQLQILTKPPFRVGYEVKLSDSPGVIALRSIDFVRATGVAKIIVRDRGVKHFID